MHFAFVLKNRNRLDLSDAVSSTFAIASNTWTRQAPPDAKPSRFTRILNRIPSGKQLPFQRHNTYVIRSLVPHKMTLYRHPQHKGGNCHHTNTHVYTLQPSNLHRWIKAKSSVHMLHTRSCHTQNIFKICVYSKESAFNLPPSSGLRSIKFKIKLEDLKLSINVSEIQLNIMHAMNHRNTANSKALN